MARWLGARRDIVVVDADDIGHRVLEDDPVKQQIRQRFGDLVLDEKGEVNRAALGRHVFGSAAEVRQARSDLEKIVHPRIRVSLERMIREARASGEIEAIILDAAVLLEAGWDELCDAVVFVDAGYRQRLERVAESRGWDEQEFALRESSQLSLVAKQAASDETIKNFDTIGEAGARLEQLLGRITSNQH